MAPCLQELFLSHMASSVAHRCRVRAIPTPSAFGASCTVSAWLTSARGLIQAISELLVSFISWRFIAKPRPAPLLSASGIGRSQPLIHAPDRPDSGLTGMAWKRLGSPECAEVERDGHGRRGGKAGRLPPAGAD